MRESEITMQCIDEQEAGSYACAHRHKNPFRKSRSEYCLILRFNCMMKWSVLLLEKTTHQTKQLKGWKPEWAYPHTIFFVRITE